MSECCQVGKRGWLRWIVCVVVALGLLVPVSGAHAQTAPTAAHSNSADISPSHEVLHLTSGDMLHGRSGAVGQGQLLWELPSGGVITIPLDDIVELQVLPGPATTFDATPQSEASGLLVPAALSARLPAPTSLVDTAQSLPTPLNAEGAAGDVVAPASTITDPASTVGDTGEPDWTHHLPLSAPLRAVYGTAVGTATTWTRRISLGGQFLDGNAVSNMVNLNVDLERSRGPVTRMFDAGGQFGDTQRQRTANRWWINSNFDWPLNEERFGEDWIAFFTTRNEYNQLANLDYRGTISTGLGYRFFNEPNKRLIGRFGPAYTLELFHRPSEYRTSPDIFGEVEIRYGLLERAILEQKFRVQPNILDFELVRLFSTTNIFLDLDSEDRWKLNLGVRCEHISIPSPGRLSTDVITTLSITYVRK